MTGTAVNVTGAPAQMLFAEATMLTEGVTRGITLTVIALLATLTGVAQAALLVMVQLTMSPVAKSLPPNVALFVPALFPLSNH